MKLIKTKIKNNEVLYTVELTEEQYRDVLTKEQEKSIELLKKPKIIIPVYESKNDFSSNPLFTLETFDSIRCKLNNVETTKTINLKLTIEEFNYIKDNLK